MSAGSFVGGVMFAGAFIAAGLVMLLMPHSLRAAGLKANESRRNWPVLGYFWYEAVRKPEYLLQMRVGGVVVVLTGLLVLYLVLRDAMVL